VNNEVFSSVFSGSVGDVELYRINGDRVGFKLATSSDDPTMFGRMKVGQLHIDAADAAAVTISGTTDYYEATAPAWTLSPVRSDFDESAGNGRLTYTGKTLMHIHAACTISFTCGSNNQTVYFRIGRNGATDSASEVQYRIGTGSDVGSTAMHLVTSMQQGDYLSLFVRNGTGANDVTMQVANLQAVAMLPG